MKITITRLLTASLAVALLSLALMATGCGVLSEDIVITDIKRTDTTATITFRTVTSENYDIYELREYGISYSSKKEELKALTDTGSSDYTPAQNTPWALIERIEPVPSVLYGKRQPVTLTVTITGLQPGVTYFFKPYVYGSYSNTGGSITSKYGYGKTSDVTTIQYVPKKPTGLKARSIKAGQAIVTWKRVAGVSGYEVEVSNKKSGGFKKVKTATNITYTQNKLKSKEIYYYRVRSFNKISGKKYYSSYSAVKSVRVR